MPGVRGAVEYAQSQNDVAPVESERLALVFVPKLEETLTTASADENLAELQQYHRILLDFSTGDQQISQELTLRTITKELRRYVTRRLAPRPHSTVAEEDWAVFLSERRGPILSEELKEDEQDDGVDIVGFSRGSRASQVGAAGDHGATSLSKPTRSRSLVGFRYFYQNKQITNKRAKLATIISAVVSSFLKSS